jgi:hypothetical protein
MLPLRFRGAAGHEWSQVEILLSRTPQCFRQAELQVSSCGAAASDMMKAVSRQRRGSPRHFIFVPFFKLFYFILYVHHVATVYVAIFWLNNLSQLKSAKEYAQEAKCLGK